MNGRQDLSASQNLKQIQRLILSPQMQQALHLLQLPILELSVAIEEELSLNPILELEEGEQAASEQEGESLLDYEPAGTSYDANFEGDDQKAYIENTIAHSSSLFDHLIFQAQEIFQEKRSFELAEAIIGNLDPGGFLSTPLEEIAALNEASVEELLPILEMIQTFDPPGIAARSTQEALLIQLKCKGKEQSLAFRIIENHYEDVLHNRIPSIAKALSTSNSKIYDTISHEIALLDLHPGTNQSAGHYRDFAHQITPDLTIHHKNDKFIIEINDETLPPLRISDTYLEMLKEKALPSETRSYIQEKILSGKWLLRNIYERNHTLYRIAEELIKRQKSFLSNPVGKLTPGSMKDIAEALELHESTVVRAIANKYIATPRGVFPLRSFFTHAYTTDEGDVISSRTVKDLLKTLIDGEDMRDPLSDETLSSMIKERGIPCARRTVAKYRLELGLGNAAQRKRH